MSASLSRDTKRVATPAQLEALKRGRGSGAGGRPQKDAKKTSVTVSLEPDLRDRLDAYATAHEVSRSVAVAELVDTGLSCVRGREAEAA